MAKELQAQTTTGLTIYAVLISAVGQIWNTSGTPAFETYNGANWTDYDIALTEAGAGIYLGDMPAATAGVYSYAVYSQAGASPATTDTLKGSGWLAWDGSAEVSPDERFDTIDSAIGSIGSGTGAALNFAAEDDNVSGAIKTITFVGVQTSGTYLSTAAEDGTPHQIDDATNEIDIIYQFNIGAGRNAAKVVFVGRMGTSTNDTCVVKAYNFVTSAWDTRATIIGQSGATNIVKDIALLSAHTGTGAEAGLVLIRFDSTATNQVLYVDSLLVAGVSVGITVGYLDGLVWVDATNGTAGTTPFVHGTADNPCTTIADAYTIAAAVGLTGLHIAPGTSLTLTQSAAKWTFKGPGALALGSQSIADAVFDGLYTISGISTGDDCFFENCGIGDATIAHAYFSRCRMKGTLTFIAAQNYFFDRCFDANESADIQTVVFAATAKAMFRDWRGGLQINSMAATNECIIDGAGRVVIDASSTAGAITIRGHFAAATNAAAFITAGGTITDTARYAEDQNVTNVTGTVATVTTLTNLPAVTTDWLTAAGVKADAVTKIQTGLATPTNITAGTITTVGSVTGAVGSVTGAVGSVSGNVVGSVGSVAAGVTISGTLTTLDAVWAKIQKWMRLTLRKDAAVAADHAVELAEINANGGSGAGAYVSTTDSQEAIKDSLGGTPLTSQEVRDAMKLAPTVGAPAAGSIDKQIDDIQTKTDNLPSDPADESALEAAITAAVSGLSTFDPAIDTVEGTITYQQVEQIILGWLAGIADGGGTSTIHFRNQADTKNRITLDGLDANGNRTSVTLDLT